LSAVPAPAQQAAVIPMPAEIKLGKGSFELSAATTIEAPRAGSGAADALVIFPICGGVRTE